MGIQENIRLNDEFIAGWNARDTERTVAVLADGAVWHDVGSPEPLRGTAIHAYVQSWYTAFPDLTAVVKNRVVTDDQVAVEVGFTGTNTGPLQMGPGDPMPPTGKSVSSKGTYFMTIRDGKVAEIHTYPDNAGTMMQLGMMPMP